MSGSLVPARWIPKLAAVVSLGAMSFAGVALGSGPAAAAPHGTGTPVQLTYSTSTEALSSVGTVNLAAIGGELPPSATRSAHHAKSSEAAMRLGRPHPTGGRHGGLLSAGSFAIAKGNVAGAVGFPGVDGPQEASVNVPNNITPTFSDVAPPDQATCAGPDANGKPITFDFVNDALAAYSTSGTMELPVTPAWGLFDQPDTAFLSDPRCYYDAPTGRWFFTIFLVGTPAPSTQFVAVSQTSDPLGNYQVFAMDTTDAANPLGDCPCFGDFDQIGADANGFYISTNEFSNVGRAPGYNGAVIYALSKQGLEAAASGTGPLPSIVRYAVTGDAFGASTATRGTGPYHVSPASTPAGGTYAPNTEYFVESDSDVFSGNKLIVYALTGTNLLASGGTPSISATELTSEGYAFPPSATQKAGPMPLGNADGFTTPSHLSADFNAVQETTYTAGRLYSELDTSTVMTPTTFFTGRDAVAWFALAPSLHGATVTASLVKQGYIANSQNLLYPDLVLDGAGNGFLDFSMSGTAEYPSAAYVAFHTQPTGPIHMANAAPGPNDDFTCYPPFGANNTPFGGCRWGDYSAGAVWAGRAYMMTETTVSTAQRDVHSNWGTFVWSAPTH